jgi:hypothetical protein
VRPLLRAPAQRPSRETVSPTTAALMRRQVAATLPTRSETLSAPYLYYSLPMSAHQLLPPP